MVPIRQHFARQSTFAFLYFLVGLSFQTAAENLRCHSQENPFPKVPGAQRLTEDGDPASRMVEGINRFLKREIKASVEKRMAIWPSPPADMAWYANETAYDQATELFRREWCERIGLVDARSDEIELVLENRSMDANAPTSSFLSERVRVSEVRWNTLPGVTSRGLILIPAEVQFLAVVVPDAGQMPEHVIGRFSVGEDMSQVGNRRKQTFALEIAEQGGLVVIPTVVSRTAEARNGRSVLTDQEYLYRSAFVLGRHLLGQQVLEVQGAIDGLTRLYPLLPVGVAGWGEGGWIAMHSAVADKRIRSVLVSGHFGPRELIYREPIHRNIQGLLTKFGDAQIACLIAPRPLVIDTSPGPNATIDGKGAAPGTLHGPTVVAAKAEASKAIQMLKPWKLEKSIQVIDAIHRGEQPSIASCDAWLTSLLHHQVSVEEKERGGNWNHPVPADKRRRERVEQWDRHQQRILDTISAERDNYWSKLDTSTQPKFQETVEPYRRVFQKDIIGTWDLNKSALNVRCRPIETKPGVDSYEVEIDVFDDVVAYGILLIPPKTAESIRSVDGKRPCVVFQHGLEGRPIDTIVGDHPAYHDVSMKLAQAGYIVFAPQNPYLFQDRFRVLQRMSNPLGKTLFSTIVAQHERIVEWLQGMPQVDRSKIAFYGLSYGGKSAMRIPALVPGYCLSICSADFNDWVWKNASTSSPYSYVWTMEYEIFEHDLGRKFNYAEMATLIAPRPFMVERGHFDGVAPDDRVGTEFAKVNRLYSGLLNLPDRCRIEWFPGPHTIHGKGTFEFLREHLQPDR